MGFALCVLLSALNALRYALCALHLLLSAQLRVSGLAALGDELQRDAVVAPSFAGGSRTVTEDMAVVAAATRAVVLGARPD